MKFRLQLYIKYNYSLLLPVISRAVDSVNSFSDKRSLRRLFFFVMAKGFKDVVSAGTLKSGTASLFDPLGSKASLIFNLSKRSTLSQGLYMSVRPAFLNDCSKYRNRATEASEVSKSSPRAT